MSSYIVKAGDDYAQVSRKVYGTEQYTGLLRKANPGVFEPLVNGSTLVVPSLPAQTRLTNIAASQFQDETILYINNQRFRKWDAVQIARSYDSIDTVNFNSAWDGSDPALRAAFKPFAFNDVRIEIGGELIFNGFMVDPTPTITPDSKSISATCYARAGVLNDCHPTLDDDSLEFENQFLPEISVTLCAPYSVPVQFSANEGSSFEKVAISPTTPILSFLAELAQQRGLVIGNTPEGRLEFKRFSPGASVATLTQGLSPLVSIDPVFSGQQYASHITGISEADIGTDTERYTIKQPFLPDKLRLRNFSAQDTDGGTLVDAVKGAAGRMFADAINYTCQVSTWRTPSGDLWAPGQVVTVVAPDAFVYSPYQFMVKDVILARSSEQKTATLNLCLLSAYTDNLPAGLPWD